jgi:hypothetical protein
MKMKEINLISPKKYSSVDGCHPTNKNSKLVQVREQTKKTP